MKHKVKKRFFKIKTNNNAVVVTEDHSIIVLRDGKMISIKPNEVKNNDRLFKIHRKPNMSKEEFENFNQSRAVTLENMIKQ